MISVIRDCVAILLPEGEERPRLFWMTEIVNVRSSSSRPVPLNYQRSRDQFAGDRLADARHNPVYGRCLRGTPADIPAEIQRTETSVS